MSDTDLMNKLWARKVPQYLGTYLAVGFGLLQFLEFVSKRFTLSGYLVDAYLLLWLALVPAVALIIYYEGLPPNERGRRWKRALVFANVVIVLALMIILPRPGAEAPTAGATETITTTDEQGVSQRRVIPAASSIQKIAVFELLNAGEEPDTDWWGSAYSILLEDDLHQRPEIMVSGLRSLNRYYTLFNLPLFSRVNLANQRKIAERAKMTYFVRAEYKVSEGSHEIFGGLYRTKDGEKVKDLNARSDNGFSAVDNIKEQILEYLPPPVILDQPVTNLPVSALITDNVEALEYFTKGEIAFSRNPGDLPPAVDAYRKSVAADASCAPCLFELADKFYGQGKADSARTLLTKATKLAEVLPEREQFKYKATLLSVMGDYGSFYSLMESARAVYPYEYRPYASLVGYYEQTYGVDSAIVLMTQAATLSDREAALIQLQGLYTRDKDYESAERVIKELDRDFATREETQTRYAKFYEQTGQLEKARSTLKSMIAIDPANLELQAQLAKMEITTGNYRTGETMVQDIMRRAAGRVDSILGWNYLIQAYAETGRIELALEELGAYEAYITKEAPVNTILQKDLLIKQDYLSRLEGQRENSEAYFQEVRKYDEQLTIAYRCYATINRVFNGREVEGAAEKLTKCEAILANYGSGMTDYLDMANLLVERQYGKVADAIDKRMEAGNEALPAEVYVRINRLAGRLPRAEELLEEELEKRPLAPQLLLEKAHLAVARGNNDAAKAPLRTVLETWREADARHIDAAAARALAAVVGVE